MDDLTVIGNSGDSILGLKVKLKDTFEKTNLPLSHLLLGIQVMQMDDGIFIS